VFKESQIESRPNGVFESLRKDNMATVVAIMKSIKDVCRIVSDTVIVTLDIADPVPWRRRWRRL
jgi:hypothetical protein